MLYQRYNHSLVIYSVQIPIIASIILCNLKPEITERIKQEIEIRSK